MRARVPDKAPGADRPRVSTPRPAVRTSPAGQGALSREGLLALQRSVGNAAATRMVEEARHQHTEGCGHRQEATPVQRAAAVQRANGTQTAAPRVDGNRLLDIIVGQNRTLGGFQFGPECRNNGGDNLISRPMEVEVKDGTKTARLAIHLNVMLRTGGEVAGQNGNSSSVHIRGSLFHLTARRLGSQNLIHQAGASILTASESVHVGRSNAAAGWNNRPDNTQRLADAAGVPAEQIITALQSRLPPSEMNDVIQRFKHDVGRVVIHALRPEVVNVTWDGDASFG